MTALSYVTYFVIMISSVLCVWIEVQLDGDKIILKICNLVQESCARGHLNVLSYGVNGKKKKKKKKWMRRP